MSSGTDFKYDEHINRRIFNSKQDILNVIEDLEIDINELERVILMAVVSDPKNLVDIEMDFVYSIKQMVEENLEEYRYKVIELSKIRNFLEVTNLK